MSLLVKELLVIGENRLREANIYEARVDAELLWAHIMNTDRSRIFMAWGDVCDDNTCDEYFELLDRRSSGVPVQHITGHQPFMDFDFKVNEHVLIPRQDTEILVETCVEHIKEKSGKVKKVLDLCTGSGAIAVSLDLICSGIEVVGADISEEALAVARENAKRNNSKVKFLQGNLFSPFCKIIGKAKFDMIVSNPPYIRSEVIPTLQREVKDHEPMLALDGGKSGLDFYERILAEAPEHLRKNGVLALEIGHDQGEDIRRLATEVGKYDRVEIIKDLAGLDRVCILVLKG